MRVHMEVTLSITDHEYVNPIVEKSLITKIYCILIPKPSLLVNTDLHPTYRVFGKYFRSLYLHKF